MSLNSTEFEKIGLIAGGTYYPILLAQEAKKRGVKIYAIGIKKLTLKEIESFVEEIKWIEFGHFMEVIDFLNRNGIKYAIMAGNVKKSSIFKNIDLDSLTSRIFQDTKEKTDMNLLDAFARELDRRGVELLDARTFLEDHIPRKGCLTKTVPTSSQWEDILFGWKVAKMLSLFDIGMTVSIKDKVVLAVEAIEGTDEAIRRASTYAGEGFVVVKVARPNQDLRFELPVVGLDTVNLLIKLKASVLAIEAEKTLFFHLQDAIKKAEESKLCLISL